MLEEDFPICLCHWTPCKSRFTILLFNGHCDCLWCKSTWMKPKKYKVEIIRQQIHKRNVATGITTW